MKPGPAVKYTLKYVVNRRRGSPSRLHRATENTREIDVEPLPIELSAKHRDANDANRVIEFSRRLATSHYYKCLCAPRIIYSFAGNVTRVKYFRLASTIERNVETNRSRRSQRLTKKKKDLPSHKWKPLWSSKSAAAVHGQ